MRVLIHNVNDFAAKKGIDCEMPCVPRIGETLIVGDSNMLADNDDETGNPTFIVTDVTYHFDENGMYQVACVSVKGEEQD